MLWSYFVWGLWALAFLVLEMLGLFRVGPWVTLSETLWALEALSLYIKLALLGGLVVLTTHLIWHIPA